MSVEGSDEGRKVHTHTHTHTHTHRHTHEGRREWPRIPVHYITSEQAHGSAVHLFSPGAGVSFRYTLVSGGIVTLGAVILNL